MSSSPPNTLPWATDPGTLTHCVMCGSRGIRRKVITVDYADGVSVPGVRAEVCRDCGEIYFDLAAMEMLEDFDRRHPRKRSGPRGRKTPSPH